MSTSVHVVPKHQYGTSAHSSAVEVRTTTTPHSTTSRSAKPRLTAAQRKYARQLHEDEGWSSREAIILALAEVPA